MDSNPDLTFLALFSLTLTGLGVIIYLFTKHSDIETKTLRKEATMQEIFSAINATGYDCIRFLERAIMPKSFKIIVTQKQVEGKFNLISRKMYLDQSFNEANAESIISGAHEFAHALQTGGFWTIINGARVLVFILILLMVTSGIIPFLLFIKTTFYLNFINLYPSISHLTLILAIIVITAYIISIIPSELDAIISSITLSKLYLKAKGIKHQELEEFLCFAVNKAKIAAIWYLLTELCMILILTGIAILIQIILFYASIALLCPKS